MRLKICPECHRLSVEFDPHQRVERCLNRHCGWVNRTGHPLVEEDPESFEFSRIMEARVKASRGGAR